MGLRHCCLLLISSLLCLFSGTCGFTTAEPLSQPIAYLLQSKAEFYYPSLLTDGAAEDVFIFTLVWQNQPKRSCFLSGTLGEASYCAVRDDQRYDRVIYLYATNTTWNSGRNLELALVMALEEKLLGGGGRRFEYFTFVDDDLVLSVDEKRAKAELPQWRRERRENPFRVFEHYLAKWKPAVATVRYNYHSYNRTAEVNTGYNFDECFHSFHRESLSLLFPYPTSLDEVSWSFGNLLLKPLADLLYRPFRLQINAIRAYNKEHRDYPKCVGRGWERATDYLIGALRWPFLAELNTTVAIRVDQKGPVFRKTCSYALSKADLRALFHPLHPLSLERRANHIAENVDVTESFNCSASPASKALLMARCSLSGSTDALESQYLRWLQPPAVVTSLALNELSTSPLPSLFEGPQMEFSALVGNLEKQWRALETHGSSFGSLFCKALTAETRELIVYKNKLLWESRYLFASAVKRALEIDQEEESLTALQTAFENMEEAAEWFELLLMVKKYGNISQQLFDRNISLSSPSRCSKCSTLRCCALALSISLSLFKESKELQRSLEKARTSPTTETERASFLQYSALYFQDNCQAQKHADALLDMFSRAPFKAALLPELGQLLGTSVPYLPLLLRFGLHFYRLYPESPRVLLSLMDAIVTSLNHLENFPAAQIPRKEEQLEALSRIAEKMLRKLKSLFSLRDYGVLSPDMEDDVRHFFHVQALYYCQGGRTIMKECTESLRTAVAFWPPPPETRYRARKIAVFQLAAFTAAEMGECDTALKLFDETISTRESHGYFYVPARISCLHRLLRFDEARRVAKEFVEDREGVALVEEAADIAAAKEYIAKHG